MKSLSLLDEMKGINFFLDEIEIYFYLILLKIYFSWIEEPGSLQSWGCEELDMTE